LLVVPCLALGQGTQSPPSTDAPQTNRVRVNYVPPTNPAHQDIYDLMKKRGTLERMQKLLSPFRLKRDLTLTVQNCGMDNAWYDSGVITVCYEYLADARKHSPKEETKDGVTPEDALVSQVYYVFLHEAGHAMFDLLTVPVFGNEESAADQFATYMLLQMGQNDARQLILGASYTFRAFMNAAQPTEATVGSPTSTAPQPSVFSICCVSATGRARTCLAIWSRKACCQNRAPRTARLNTGRWPTRFSSLSDRRSMRRSPNRPLTRPGFRP
jgi:hypothetical protein